MPHQRPAGTGASTVAGPPRRIGRSLDTAGSTHVGYVRNRNEDALLHAPERSLFVVADGMGGHPAGDVASRITVETLDELLEGPGDDPAGALSDAIHRAHDALADEIKRDPATDGMGTTVVAAFAYDERLVLASVGDSRAYRLRDGHLKQLTSDDVWEAAFGRSLTQALGSGPITPEVLDLKLHAGDRLLLCTDGLTDMVPDALIADVLGSPLSASEIVSRLEASALDHGGYDNITLIAILR